jgi:hypothetical protein
MAGEEAETETYRPVMMDARLRGVVHVPTSAGNHDIERQEAWHSIEPQWYTFLLIDS